MSVMGSQRVVAGELACRLRTLKHLINPQSKPLYPQNPEALLINVKRASGRDGFGLMKTWPEAQATRLDGAWAQAPSTSSCLTLGMTLQRRGRG